jgi:hypothetical protein
MAHFLFVDESGYDSGESPYGVLGGAAIEDRELWSVVKEIRSAEVKYFGIPYSAGKRELKAKKLLNRKVFRHAQQLDPFPTDERALLARACLEQGEGAGRRQLTALAQAKIAYIAELMNICSRFRCKAFASIVVPVQLKVEFRTKEKGMSCRRNYQEQPAHKYGWAFSPKSLMKSSCACRRASLTFQ